MKPNSFLKRFNKPTIDSHQIQVGDKNYPVTIKRKPFSRSLSLRLKPIPGDIIICVSAPKSLSVSAVLEYVYEKSAWLEKDITPLQKNPPPTTGTAGRGGEYGGGISEKFLKQASLEYLTERVAHYENIYQLFSTKVETRKFTARWGSCDRQGVLKFNYQLMLLPKPIIDYIVVHEICHLKELNHGPQFWKLVSQEIPDYAKRRKWLRQNQLRIISSLP